MPSDSEFSMRTRSETRKSNLNGKDSITSQSLGPKSPTRMVTTPHSSVERDHCDNDLGAVEGHLDSACSLESLSSAYPDKTGQRSKRQTSTLDYGSNYRNHKADCSESASGRQFYNYN